MNISSTSQNILDGIIDLYDPINELLGNLWFKPEWFFIVISGILGAYVAIRIEREIENKRKLYDKKLWKLAISTTLEATARFWITPIIWFILFVIFVYVLKLGRNNYPTITVILLFGLILYYLWKRKRKKEELISRLKKNEKKISKN